MLASRSRRLPFRRAVVQVVAAFAPLAGCDLVLEPDEPEVSQNPPACASPSSPGCMPPVEECPEAPPVDGAACNLDGQWCNYETLPSWSEASCEGGSWVVTYLSVNPPFYAECPAAPPRAGEPCDTDPEVWCEFGHPCDHGSAICDRGAWRIEYPSCNPPEPQCGVDLDCECPLEAPVAGAACEPALVEPCGYGDCYGAPTTTASCVNGVWELSEVSCNPPPPDLCPELEPLPGSPCAHVGESCSYGDCLGSPTRFADCVNGSWTFSEVSCNPPPVEE